MNTITKATRRQKITIVNTLVNAFMNDPQTSYIIGNKGVKMKNLRRLMEYSFEQGMANDAVYVAQDGEAVAIWKKDGKDKFNLRMMFQNLKFLAHFGLKQISIIGKMEKSIKAKYPENTNFSYLWLLAVSPKAQGKGLSSALMNAEIEKNDQAGINTYLETSTEKNLAIYARKGFEVYDSVSVQKPISPEIFLLRRSPKLIA